MTRSRPSAIKFRLSKLFHWLAVLCFIKIIILCLMMLEMPLDWLDVADTKQTAIVEIRESAQSTLESPVVTEKNNSHANKSLSPDIRDEMPQGVEAARLAAATRPRLKVPPVSAPPPLAPNALLAAEPGSSLQTDDNVLNILSLTHLPIPTLGSIQAAYAAVQDMPVPQTATNTASPFVPAEQTAPMGYPTPNSLSVPKLPDGQFPVSHPVNNGMNNTTDIPELPRNRDVTVTAPAPYITSSTFSEGLDDKAQELARQQQDILMLRQQMDERLKELEEAEAKMKNMIREARDLEERKVHNLVQMYANMKPRMAAKALESMDESIAVRILSGMAPKQSGEILTYTNPSKTAKFTELITRMRMPE